MPRVKRGFKARQRRNKVLKLAKGYRGARSKLFRSATEAVDRALNYAFRDRRVKKSDFRACGLPGSMPRHESTACRTAS